MTGQAVWLTPFQTLVLVPEAAVSTVAAERQQRHQAHQISAVTGALAGVVVGDTSKAATAALEAAPSLSECAENPGLQAGDE